MVPFRIGTRLPVALALLPLRVELLRPFKAEVPLALPFRALFPLSARLPFRALTALPLKFPLPMAAPFSVAGLIWLPEAFTDGLALTFGLTLRLVLL